MRFLGGLFDIFKVFSYCVSAGVNLVYIDEWLYFRHSPFRLILTELLLKLAYVRIVIDQRDPYVDFEVARGAVKEGSSSHKLMSLQYALILRFASLIILPSEAYANLLVGEGVPPRKVLGKFRGIDTSVFHPGIDGDQVRKRLGLEGKFVIGWFGVMHKHLLIEEVIVPIIRKVKEIIPDSHVLVGGKGPLVGQFIGLEKEIPSSYFTFLGLLPYEELPEYIAACNVLLCPVDTHLRFSRHSAWLKIPEALAIGRPIVATETEITRLDYKNLKGVVWVGSDPESFLEALAAIRADSSRYALAAEAQATEFREFAASFTVPYIVDRILALVAGRPDDHQQALSSSS